MKTEDKKLSEVQDMQLQLISSLINEPALYFNNRDGLKSELFGKHTDVFMCFSKIADSGKNVDVVSVGTELGDFDRIVSIASYYNQNFDFENTLEHVKDYVSKLKLKSIVGDFFRMADSDDETKDVVQRMIEKLSEISYSDKSLPKNLSKHKELLVSRLSEILNSAGETGIYTGINDFDRFSGGLQKSDLVILAGATSQGKTSLSITMGKFASKRGTKVAFFSYEMSTYQLTSRIISQETEISSKNILRARISPVEFNKIKATDFNGIELFIDECKSNSLGSLIASIKYYVISLNIELFFIDYMQLISNFSKGKSKEQEIAEIARTLKNLAKQLNVCIVALSQLSRNQRGAGEPKLSDLRDSGQIEEAADVVLLVHRPEFYGIMEDENGQSTVGVADIIVAKGRNIGTTKIKVGFEKELTLFKNIENSYEQRDYTEPF